MWSFILSSVWMNQARQKCPSNFLSILEEEKAKEEHHQRQVRVKKKKSCDYFHDYTSPLLDLGLFIQHSGTMITKGLRI